MAVKLWEYTLEEGYKCYGTSKIEHLQSTEGIFIPLTAIRKVECPDCIGTGIIHQDYPDKPYHCPRCLGSGKLNEFTEEQP